MSTIPYRKISPYITYTPKYIEINRDPNYFKADVTAEEFTKNDTVWSMTAKMAKEVPDYPLFGTRQYDKEKGVFTEYKFLTYAETVKIVEQYASGLVELGLKKGDVCTECFDNCVEWMIHDLALFRHGATASPLRRGFNSEYFKNIISLTEPNSAIVGVDKIDSFLDVCEALIKDSVPLNYKFIVVMPQPMGPLYGTESVKPEQYERAKGLGFRLVKWDEVMALGKEHPHPEEEPNPLSIHSILFTSGTTSNKIKGVPVSQRGLLCFNSRFGQYKHITFYSYVHMSYISDRSIIPHAIGTQSCVGFASGSLATFFDDTEKLHPDLLGVTPAHLRAFQTKSLEVIRSGVPKETARAIFRQKLGGHEIKFCNYGASCPEDLCEWVTDFLGMTFCSIYGLTETGSSNAITRHSRGIIPFGCIGQPGALSTFRLIDAPESGCSIHDDPPRGEILIRGPGNMTGYLKNPEKTAETIDDELFVHTSDLAQLNDDGTLTLIDRRDNMMKLGNAAYIPPEKIEGFLTTSFIVAQGWVYARPQDAFIVSVVVPNFAALGNDARLPTELKEKVVAAGKNAEGPEAAEVCADERVSKIYVEEFGDIARKNFFPDHWIVKGVLLDPIRWTEGNGILTVSNKLKRRNLIAKYSEKIDDLVAKL